ncbi:hypothetical protein HanIR_Chr15g0741721 [Helianthus annuus]|nr:hypothetical protein HanIR_Chr15g0741721 [Helianthus annuus]
MIERKMVIHGTPNLCCQRRKAQARRIGLAQSLGAKKAWAFLRKAHREKKNYKKYLML